MRFEPNAPIVSPSETARRALLTEASYIAAGAFLVLGFIGYVVFGLLR